MSWWRLTDQLFSLCHPRCTSPARRLRPPCVCNVHAGCAIKTTPRSSQRLLIMILPTLLSLACCCCCCWWCVGWRRARNQSCRPIMGQFHYRRKRPIEKYFVTMLQEIEGVIYYTPINRPGWTLSPLRKRGPLNVNQSVELDSAWQWGWG